MYFHVSAWKSDIAPKVGMKVTFDFAPSHRVGYPDQAVNIVPVPIVVNAVEVQS